MAHLVIVEDDERIAAPLVRALTREGYSAEHVDRGQGALERLRRGGVDLVLLDLGLPDMDGLDVCKQVRDEGLTTPVLIVTARDDELDRVVGLDVGADDYMSKPFALAELLARVRALLRRASVAPPGPAGGAATPVVATGVRAAQDEGTPAVVVDRSGRRVWILGAELALTPKEYDLLALLEGQGGAVLTRDQIVREVWGENWFGSTKMLDATLGRLRQKLEDAHAPIRVTTVRGVGFRIDEDPRA